MIYFAFLTSLGSFIHQREQGAARPSAHAKINVVGRTKREREVGRQQGYERAMVYHDVWDVLYGLQDAPGRAQGQSNQVKLLAMSCRNIVFRMPLDLARLRVEQCQPDKRIHGLRSIAPWHNRLV